MVNYCRSVCFLLLFPLAGTGYASDTIFSNDNYFNPYFRTLQFDFEHISTDQGLSQSSVVCMLQDRFGFMWFGTYNGLCRYDGFNFDVFLNNPQDSTSLSNNMIWSLLEDETGDIWIGTWNGGLNRLPAGKNQFTHYRHNPEDPGSISDDIVRCMFRDSKGNFWIGTQSGLNLFDKKTGTFRRIPLKHNGVENAQDKNILCILESKDKKLWIGTDIGLFQLNTDSFETINYTNDSRDNTTISIGGVTSLCEDSKGNLWIGTWGGGLNLLNPSSQKFTHYVYNPGNPNSLSNNVILSILEDDDGRLWLGTRGGGISIFYPENHQFFTLFSDPSKPKNLSGNMVYSIYSDSDNIIWVGTDYGGINKYDQHKKIFRSFGFNLNAAGEMPFDLVTAVYEDSKNRIWIGGEGGFAVYDRTKNQFKKYPVVNQKGTFRSGVVRAIVEDKNGCMWIGSDGGGVEYFNPVTGKTISYMSDATDPTSLSQNYIYSIVIDKTGIVWIATQNYGLCRFNKLTNSFTRYSHDPANPKSLACDALKMLMIDSKNNLWIGTSTRGLSLYDRKNDYFTSFQHKEKDTTSISDNYIISLWEDNDGFIWAGTMDRGLNKLDPKSKTFTRYSAKDGLCSNRIFGILSDNSNNIWVSTNKGLSVINHVTDSITSYYRSDGLATDEFQIKSYFKSHTGELLFGGKQNLVIFDPTGIKPRIGKPRMALTGIRLFNKPIPVGKMDDGRTILNQSVNLTKNIILSYEDLVLTIEFAILHYASPGENNYAYKMEGFEKEWNYVGNNHSATYTNLPPGDYIFKVIGSNCDDIWNQDGIELHITVTPPFWKTWWFRLLIILLLAGLVLFLLDYRIKRMKKINKVLEGLVDERTSEIMDKNKILINQTEQLNQFNQLLVDRQKQVEEQAEELSAQKEELISSKNKLEITNLALNESNAAKDKLFSIIAHDLRSPFNSLLGMTELLNVNYDKWDREKVKHFINLVNNSANQAYGLLDNLLVWARRQQQQIIFSPDSLFIDKLIAKCIRLFSETAKTKEIDIDFQSEHCEASIMADNMMLETIVRNLLSNAIKFTPRNGRIKINCFRVDHEIRVSVADSGNGIPTESQNHLFKPNSFSTRGTEDEKGSGLGLVICKDFVEQHQGKLWFETEKGKGTTFIFTIPFSA